MVRFVMGTRYEASPREVVRLARSLVPDALGVTLAPSTERGSRIIRSYIREMSGRAEASALSSGFKAPVDAKKTQKKKTGRKR